MPFEKGVAGGAQDGERRHVGAEERQQKHGGPERPSGEEEVLRIGLLRRRAAGDETDREDGGQVNEDDGRWDHSREQSVVQVHRCTESGDAPGWQGATTEHTGSM